MALSQEERIAISKKIVQIPQQNAASDTIVAQIDAEKAKAQKEDDANKTLMDDVTVLINGYQTERERYDANGHNQLLEQDLLSSADRTLGNFFFPNDTQTPTPSIADGVWKQFIPHAYNKALGKSYAEAYSVVAKEQTSIDDVLAKIAVVESFSNITRSTGQSCGATGTCSLPQYTTQSDCTTNGGLWTPGPDLISNSSAMQAAGSALIASVLAWESFMNATFAIIPTNDTEPIRAAQNTASKADITNAISIIDTWQALTTYNTAHGQTTCIGFNAYNFNLLGPVKFRAAELQPIKDELIARQAFITTRLGQLNTDLGTVVQNLADGSLTTATGMYGKRMKIINSRLNAMGGSLSKLKGLQRGQSAQEQAKDSNANTASVYSSVMLCSAFRAPSTGTSTIHVLDGTGFAIGNAVYVCADNQEEIATTITNVQGNTIYLADKIPQKYRQNELARLYKIL